MTSGHKSPYPHLHPEAAALIGATLEARLEYLERPYYIPYEASEQVLSHLGRMMASPKVPRMPCALLMSDSNNGKTTLMRKFLNGNPSLVDPTLLATVQPVIKILAPPLADESRLYLALLKATNTPIPKNTPARSLQGQVETVLAAIGTKIILIDEFQHFMNGSSRQQEICLAALKNLSTNLRISIVGSGTKNAFDAIRRDPQLENRFVPWELGLWTKGEAFDVLLRAMVSRVPLPEASTIFTDPIKRSILLRTGGLIGEVRSLVLVAGRWALEKGKPLIDSSVLDACGYRGPGERTP